MVCNYKYEKSTSTAYDEKFSGRNEDYGHRRRIIAIPLEIGPMIELRLKHGRAHRHPGSA